MSKSLGNEEVKVEAFTICVNYSDYLEYTLPWNYQLADRFVVITSSADIDTRRLCDRLGVECLVTDVFYDHGASFNKGAAINEGFKTIQFNDWVLHIDSDVIVLGDWEKVKRSLPSKRKDHIYGIDHRLGLSGSHEDLLNWINKYSKRKEELEYIDNTGFGPLGYFQLFHSSYFEKYPRSQWYPWMFSGCNESDLFFNGQFKGHEFLDLECIHFGECGKNWFGRKAEV